MVNNYTQVSVILVIPKEQADWFKQKASDEDYLLTEIGTEFLSIQIEDTEHGLWLSGDEFDVMGTAILIQLMFKEFNSDKHFVFQWADTCDRMRVYEFSGGSVYIDKDQIISSARFVR